MSPKSEEVPIEQISDSGTIYKREFHAWLVNFVRSNAVAL